jgi:hypothetical protein
MSVTNKRLLISESRGDSNRCTPCRGKPDQHDTYASHASPHTPGVRFLRAVPVRGNLLRSRQQIWTDPLPLITDETVGKSQASVDNRLLGLSDPYQRHAISTFNTCMWGATHRSLIDSGRGYSLEGANFPRTTPWPSQPAVFTFHLRALPGLQFNQVLSIKPKMSFRTYGRHVVFRPLGHLL